MHLIDLTLQKGLGFNTVDSIHICQALISRVIVMVRGALAHATLIKAEHITHSCISSMQLSDAVVLM